MAHHWLSMLATENYTDYFLCFIGGSKLHGYFEEAGKCSPIILLNSTHNYHRYDRTTLPSLTGLAISTLGFCSYQLLFGFCLFIKSPALPLTFLTAKC